jgi:hypothetical protein
MYVTHKHKHIFYNYIVTRDIQNPVNSETIENCIQRWLCNIKVWTLSN